MVGQGAGAAADVTYLELACLDIAQSSTTDKIVVEKSTVPVRTAEALRTILESTGKSGVKFEVLSNPEFLAEGTAVNDLLHPDRVLIGSMPTLAGSNAAQRLADLYSWVPRGKIVHTDVFSSELAKLASNAFLAQRISSINSLSAICEATGASVDQVAMVVGQDTRIGSKMLKSSVGFGGSCFKKDILNLCYLAETLHLPHVANYWRGVIEINEWQKNRLTHKLLHKLNNTLTHKTIAVFGFAYKKDTSDARESAAIDTVKHLISEGAQVRIYDPKVTEQTVHMELKYVQVEEQKIKSHVMLCSTAEEAATNASAIVILTDWDEFKSTPINTNGNNKPEYRTARIDSAVASPTPDDSSRTERSASGSSTNGLIHKALRLNIPGNSSDDTYKGKRVDWTRIGQVMRRPPYVLDGRNVTDVNVLTKLGFTIENIGNAGLSINRDTRDMNCLHYCHDELFA